MHAKLAVLAAIAVVFAPGWPGELPRRASHSSDLAARVLAPTFDKGAIREVAAEAKHQLKTAQAKRSGDASFLAAEVFGFGALTLVVLAVLAIFRTALLPLSRGLPFSTRAPPRLQPA